MLDHPVTHEALHGAVADLKAYIGERFKIGEAHQRELRTAVTERLDAINGSVARHDRELATVGARVDRMEVDLESHPRNCPLRDQLRAEIQLRRSDDSAPAVTRGDLKRGAAMLAFLTGGVAALIKIIELASAALSRWFRP